MSVIVNLMVGKPRGPRGKPATIILLNGHRMKLSFYFLSLKP